MTHTHTAMMFALTLLAATVMWPVLPAQGQDDASAPPPQAVAPQPPPQQVAQPQPLTATSMGGCDSSGVSLSRPWIGRNSTLEWWAWGFAQGTQVGVMLVDSRGATIPLGSASIDNLCEASGVVTADNR